jgi:NADH-quinone oxidoreductase subunit K
MLKYILILLIILGFINIILKREQLIIIIISIELIMISIAIYFILISLDIDDSMGLLNSIYILIIGATESAIALTILILFFKYY